MEHYESFLSPDIGHLKHFITNVVITRIGTSTMAAQAYVLPCPTLRTASAWFRVA